MESGAGRGRNPLLPRIPLCSIQATFGLTGTGRAASGKGDGTIFYHTYHHGPGAQFWGQYMQFRVRVPGTLYAILSLIPMRRMGIHPRLRCRPER